MFKCKVLKALRRLRGRLDRALASADELLQRSEEMSAELEALKTQVSQNRDLTQSAVTLIRGLAAQIEANKTDPAALQALADDLRAQDTDLGDALKANTPAQPAGGGTTGGTAGPPPAGSGSPAAGRP